MKNEDQLQMLHMEKMSPVNNNVNTRENLTHDPQTLATDISEEPPPPPYSGDDRPLTDSPPSYDSILSFIKAAKTSSMNRKEALSGFMILFFDSAGCTVTLALLLSVPISMIAIGIIYIHDCPLEKFIPIYLIVTAIISIYFLLRGLYRKMIKRKVKETEEIGEIEEKESIWDHLSGLLCGCFFVGWFIAGNIWIFENTSSWSLFKDSPNYCHPVLYEFAFYLLISAYIVVCIAIICFICLVA